MVWLHKVCLVSGLLVHAVVYATVSDNDEIDLLKRIETVLDNSVQTKNTLQQDGSNVRQLVVLQRELQLRGALKGFIERETEDEREILLLELQKELDNLKATLNGLKVNKRYCWWCRVGSKGKPDYKAPQSA